MDGRIHRAHDPNGYGSKAYGGIPGVFRNSYAYINNARYTNNGETNITSPDTLANETLLVMVDLDAGTIRIRGSGDSASTLLFSGLVFNQR